MNRPLRSLAVCAILAAVCVVIPNLFGHVPPPQSPAQALREKAQAAEKKRDYVAAAAAYKALVELDPNNVSAHASYMSAVRSAQYAKSNLGQATKPGDAAKAIYAAREGERAELHAVYQVWEKQFPDSAAVQWAVGKINFDEPEVAEKYFLKSVSLDPKLDRAYRDLGFLAQLQDDRQKAVDYFKKATEADPKNDYYAYMYASALRFIDRAASLAACRDLATRFHDKEWAPRGLFDYAKYTGDMQEKISVLEESQHLFAGTKDEFYGASELINAYLVTQPAKAAALAQAAGKDAKHPSLMKYYKDLGELGTKLAQARTYIDQGKTAEAQKLLESVRVPESATDTGLHLLRAEAYSKAGATDQAFALLADLVAKQRNPLLNSVLLKYGAQLNKTPEQVDSEIWRIRTATAKPLEEFELTRLDNGQKVKLSDHRGKVVMLNFWFPT